MSAPDYDIIRSQEAEAFLRSTTQGFYNRSYIGLWIYEVIGREWDELRQWSEGMRTEIHPQTCTWSIAIWEWVYGFELDESLTLEERRRRILSKVIGARPINPEVIRRGITTLSGIETKVTDLIAPYAFGITLYPDVETMPDEAIPDGRIVQYVQAVKPAHLRVDIGIEVRREFRQTILFHQGSAVGSCSTFEPVVPEHIAASTSLSIRHSVFSNTKTISDTPASQKTSTIPISFAQGAFERPQVIIDPPSVKRAATGAQKSAGGVYCHTHMKSRLIE